MNPRPFTNTAPISGRAPIPYGQHGNLPWKLPAEWQYREVQHGNWTKHVGHEEYRGASGGYRTKHVGYGEYIERCGVGIGLNT